MPMGGGGRQSDILQEFQEFMMITGFLKHII
jgi:hypothetical protein